MNKPVSSNRQSSPDDSASDATTKPGPATGAKPRAAQRKTAKPAGGPRATTATATGVKKPAARKSGAGSTVAQATAEATTTTNRSDAAPRKQSTAARPAKEQAHPAPAAPPAPAPEREVELKLVLDRDGLAKLKRSELIRKLTDGRATSQALESVYFDTPDRALRAAGVELRIRRVSRKLVQTVKADRSTGVGALDRLEWEIPVDDLTPTLDAAALPKGLPKVLRSPDTQAALMPCFTVAQSRTKRTLAPNGARIAMALDDAAISLPHGKRTSFVELELELVAGPVAALYELAIALADDFPLTPSHLSKSDRGYALMAGGQPKAAKIPLPSVTAGASVADTLRTVAHACLHQYVENGPAIRARSDIEGVHQARVALRRLRSAFTVFRPALQDPEARLLADEIKWLATQMGDARDLDVFLTETLAPVRGFLSPHDGLDALSRAAKLAREEAYARAIETVGGARAATILLRFGRWLDRDDWHGDDVGAQATLASPITGFAEQVLDNRLEKVRKLGKRLGKLTVDEQHDLRLRIKKMRYAVEFLSGPFGDKRAKAYARKLATLQDGLGGLNDVAVAGPLMARLSRIAQDADDRRALQEARGLVLGWHSHRSVGELATLAKSWADLDATKPFWR